MWTAMQDTSCWLLRHAERKRTGAYGWSPTLTVQWLFSTAAEFHIAHPHTQQDAALAVLPDLPDGWEGSSGHVFRSDAVGVSKQVLFRGENLSGFRFSVRQVSCCCPDRAAAHTAQTHSHSSSTAEASGGGGVVSFLNMIGPGGTGAFTCLLPPPSPPAARSRGSWPLVQSQRLQPVRWRLRWAHGRNLKSVQSRACACVCVF